MSATAASAKSGQWLGHPRGLFILFLTEMWERFSYYGMRALLVLYMTQHLLVNAAQGQYVFGYETLRNTIEAFLRMTGFPAEMTTQVLSSQIYGLYTGLVYMTPFFGGIIADRFWGQRKSVYVGGILMAIGHFLMAVESLFFPALFFLILGNGCFKPNISTQVGTLYPEGDPRRDSAFTLFYMGINLGAFFSPFICGTLGQKVGWHWGFAAAGIGMLAGLAVYHFGRKQLPPDYFDEVHKRHTEHAPLTKNEKLRVWSLLLVFTLSIIFWAVYEQQGNTLQLWADSHTDWNFFGWEVPSTWYQAMNPFFIFVFAPVLSRFWQWQAKKGKEPSTTAKLGIGSLLLGGAFIIMIIGAEQFSGEGKLSVMWLAMTTLIFTIGELYFSPVGLSLTTKVSPVRIVSMMMGLWFFASFLGNYVAAYIGSYYDVMTKQAFFSLLMGLGVSAGVIYLALRKPVEKMLQSR